MSCLTRRSGPRALAAGLAAAVSLIAVPAPLAHAVEVVPRPVGGLSIAGHGYGHGRGMSQWGAYGAATAGLSAAQILAFYYPGTSLQALPDSTIRVALNDTDGDTIIAPAPGLQVTSGATTVPLPTGAAYTRWRAVGTTAVALQYRRTDGAWASWTPPGLTLGTDVSFTATGGVVRVLLPSGVWQDVRGALHATTAPGKVRSVLHTPMETYLRGVVPNEMPASWHAQALSAQAVAARTYAAAYRERQRASRSWYDICDTVSCQVFSGVAQYPGGERVSREDPRTDAAIAATAGRVLRTTAAPTAPFVNAEFSSANGGWTAAGSQPYQVAKADPYDGRIANQANSWTDTVPVTALDQLGVGTFRRLVILSRDGHGDYGGRILSARLEGDRGARAVTGDELRWAFGLKSSWFRVTGTIVARPDRDFTGDGQADVLAREPHGELRLYAGDGSTIGTGSTVGVGWGGMLDIFAVGDFDGAVGQDIVARTSDHRLLLYSGDGRSGWTGMRQIGNGWSAFRNFVSPGDWDGDGRPDIVAINRSTGQLVLSRNIGGRLTSPVAIGRGWGGFAQLVAPGDFDGDGRTDLVGVLASGAMMLYSTDGAGHFARQRQIGNGWSGMAHVWSPGDVNGDARSDLLAVQRSSGALWLYPGGPNATFGAPAALGSGWGERTPVR